jgi:hypothetical protein
VGRIKKKGISILDDSEDEKSISYCPRCLKQGFKSLLQERIYTDGQIQRDHDLWRQCHECGIIVPINEVMRERRLIGMLDPTKNAFDSMPSVIGLGNKNKLSASEKARQKLLERIEKEKDEEIKRELRRGNVVNIIENSLDY